jgi:hypothetical protein
MYRASKRLGILLKSRRHHAVKHNTVNATVLSAFKYECTCTCLAARYDVTAMKNVHKYDTKNQR